MIDPTTVVRRKPDLLAYDMDGETVMMSVEQGDYFALDPVGGRIWALIAEPIAVALVVETLIAEFDVNPDVCATETCGFLEELIAFGIIEVIDEPRP